MIYVSTNWYFKVFIFRYNEENGIVKQYNDFPVLYAFKIIEIAVSLFLIMGTREKQLISSSPSLPLYSKIHRKHFWHSVLTLTIDVILILLKICKQESKYGETCLDNSLEIDK